MSDLKDSSKYPGGADVMDVIDSLEIPRDAGDRYGVRLRGYVTPLVSGDYRFYIASDDSGELRVGTSASASRVSRVAYVDGWSDYREWDKSSFSEIGREEFGSWPEVLY